MIFGKKGEAMTVRGLLKYAVDWVMGVFVMFFACGLVFLVWLFGHLKGMNDEQES